MIYDAGNPGLGLGQSQKFGRGLIRLKFVLSDLEFQRIRYYT
jgi:hypothetical protein